MQFASTRKFFSCNIESDLHLSTFLDQPLYYDLLEIYAKQIKDPEL